MLLSREFVAYLSRQLVRRLTPQIIETSDPNAAGEMIGGIIQDELQVEDRLNDEVREMLANTAITCGARASATRRCSGASRTR